MSLLLSAEWMRFWRSGANILITLFTLLLLCASAWLAGTAAQAQREQAQAKLAGWERQFKAQVSKLPPTAGAESKDAARAAFEFGRNAAPPALRPAPGGLVLSARQFALLPTDVRVSTDSRHLDPRKSAPLTNPLLDSFGAADFAVVAALLIPLAIIGLSYGLVPEAREQGIWRVLRSQMRVPLHMLWAGLGIRLAVVFGIGAVASALAFLLDPLASGAALLAWLAALLVYVVLWLAIAALFNLLRLSSAASALGMLSLFIIAHFVLPAGLYAVATRYAPPPQRESTVIEVRTIQQEAEEKMAALLKEWYEDHRGERPATMSEHTWPVSYVPKIIWQDSKIGPLMAAFDTARVRQAELIDPWTWVAPGLALARVGDKLGGADPRQYQRYALAVERHELAWRQFLHPSVMNYRGMAQSQLAALPKFGAIPADGSGGPRNLIAGLLLLTLAIAGVVALLVRRYRGDV